MSKPWDHMRERAPLGVGKWSTSDGVECELCSSGPNWAWINVDNIRHPTSDQGNVCVTARDLRLLAEFFNELADQLEVE